VWTFGRHNETPDTHQAGVLPENVLPNAGKRMSMQLHFISNKENAFEETSLVLTSMQRKQ
jgi:hypothetical protein